MWKTTAWRDPIPPPGHPDVIKVQDLHKGTPRAPIRCPPQQRASIEEESTMLRYGFTIRTRMGQRVENVSIIAASQVDAERRLRQMYVQCEILECRERSIPRRFEAANAHMIDLRAISPPTIQHHG